MPEIIEENNEADDKEEIKSDSPQQKKVDVIDIFDDIDKLIVQKDQT